MQQGVQRKQRATMLTQFGATPPTQTELTLLLKIGKNDNNNIVCDWKKYKTMEKKKQFKKSQNKR